jgi:hypothetical protein
VHKYYINATVDHEIPFNEAALSWYHNVYQPVMHVIKKYHLLRKFKNRTTSDLYVWIIKQWDEVKQKYGVEYSLDETTRNLARDARKPLLKRIAGWFEKKH